MMTRCDMFGRRVVVAALAGAVIAALAAFSGAAAGAAGPAVAVALFYEPSPVPTYPGVDPEAYGAAALSAALAADAGGRLTVVPPDRVRAAEYALHWRGADALRFARLGDLAHAVGADRVVIGQIRNWSLDSMGGGGGKDFEVGGGSGGMLTGLADVVYQVFDAAQGRIVYETQAQGNGIGSLQGTTARETLNDADQRGAAQLLGALTIGAGAP
jgi:hypothetical protein